MKKIILTGSLFLTTVMGILLSGCSKGDFSNNYYNPEKAVTADVQRLYSGLFNNSTILPRYWNLYTFQIPVLGTYSQTSGYTQAKGVYEQPTNYTGNRWDDFYTTVVSRYREIEKHYNALTTDADKAGYRIMLETSKIFVYDQATQIVDMWGDVPFTTAGGLNSQGKIILASYDGSQALYSEALTNLKSISDYLASANIPSFYLTQLASYDYLNGGSVLKWRKYCNSLMLRLAMRISIKDETAAKTLIQTILANPNTYPLIDVASESITLQPGSVTSSMAANATEVREGFAVNPFAAGTMVNDIMAPNSDPRLAAYFTTNASGNYKGISNTLTEAQITAGIAASDFSRWDSTTFSENRILPGIIMTAAEVSFLKAEAYERWGGGTAKTAYETGIRQSIAFWYGINTNSSASTPKAAAPTELEITTYLAKLPIAYGTNNLSKIATQKWIDFTIMQAHQAWAEIRRTNLPALAFPTDASSTAAPNVPTRLLYPTSESTLNTANYSSVKSKDNTTTKIFWDVN